ncbi:MAG: SpaA isopeptide-forming pilin-related protein [Anaerolineales bacterium]
MKSRLIRLGTAIAIVLLSLGRVDLAASEISTIIETMRATAEQMPAQTEELLRTAPTDILPALMTSVRTILAASPANADLGASQPVAVQPAPQPEASTAGETTSPEPAGKATPDPDNPFVGGTCIKGNIIDHYHQAVGAGWTVRITREEDGKTHTTQADANGRYMFSGLGAGLWVVHIDAPAGWLDITPRTLKVPLSGEGSACAEPIRYKVLRPACLIVKKVDKNGQLGLPDMVGIPGWEITISNGTEKHTCTTNGLGQCQFTDLRPGTWIVTEESKIGWIPSLGFPAKQTIVLESPRDAGICEEVIFVNEQIHDSCIDVCKVDVDGQPLSGWHIRVIRDDGTQPSEAQTTGLSGCVRFIDLPVGDWTVQEKIHDWWRPIGNASQTVTLSEPGTCQQVDFTNEPLGCIDGYKINHLDQGLDKWVIKTRNTETGEEFTTVTDQNGYFKFKGLPLGTWIVSEEMQPGWKAVTSSEYEVPLTEPFTCEHVRFKNRTKYACLDVRKIDIFDGSGLADWEIVLKPAYGTSEDTIIQRTNGMGHTRFNGLTPGIYDVYERPKEGWEAISPTSHRVNLEATGTCDLVTFKNRQINAPTCDSESPPPDTLPETGATPEPTSPPAPTPTPAPACQATHIVERGNTLYAIAKRYGVTVDTIRQANGMTSNDLSVGQQLCIP